MKIYNFYGKFLHHTVPTLPLFFLVKKHITAIKRLHYIPPNPNLLNLISFNKQTKGNHGKYACC